jgi:hypothetical protein
VNRFVAAAEAKLAAEEAVESSSFVVTTIGKTTSRKRSGTESRVSGKRSKICEIEDEEISVTDRALVNNDMLLKALDEELVEIRKLSIQFASHVAKVEKIRILIKNNHQDY